MNDPRLDVLNFKRNLNDSTEDEADLIIIEHGNVASVF